MWRRHSCHGTRACSVPTRRDAGRDESRPCRLKPAPLLRLVPRPGTARCATRWYPAAVLFDLVRSAEKPVNGYMTAAVKAVERSGDTMAYARIFLYLQVLDFLTTLLGFKMGAAEMSPFVRALIHFGPIAGVAASKIVALAMAGL